MNASDLHRLEPGALLKLSGKSAYPGQEVVFDKYDLATNQVVFHFHGSHSQLRANGFDVVRILDELTPLNGVKTLSAAVATQRTAIQSVAATNGHHDTPAAEEPSDPTSEFATLKPSLRAKRLAAWIEGNPDKTKKEAAEHFGIKPTDIAPYLWLADTATDTERQWVDDGTVSLAYAQKLSREGRSPAAGATATMPPPPGPSEVEGDAVAPGTDTPPRSYLEAVERELDYAAPPLDPDPDRTPGTGAGIASNGGLPSDYNWATALHHMRRPIEQAVQVTPLSPPPPNDFQAALAHVGDWLKTVSHESNIEIEIVMSADVEIHILRKAAAA